MEKELSVGDNVVVIVHGIFQALRGRICEIDDHTYCYKVEFKSTEDLPFYSWFRKNEIEKIG